MRDNHTQLVVVLDRSGSMGMVEAATVEGFNEFVNSQKKAPGTADLTFIRFDDVVETMYTKNVNEVEPLTTLEVRGMTALYDAVGTAVKSVGEKLAALPEHDRPSKVVVAIFTDGHENSSKEFTQPQVAAMIKEQKEKYNWDFSFFGANQDAVLTGAKFNIDANQSYTFNANAGSVKNVMKYAGASTTMFRGGVVRSEAFIGSMKAASLSSTEVDDATLQAQVQANNSGTK